MSKSAFGEDDTEDRNSTRHLILYEGKQQTRKEFLKSAFQEYRKYPCKVQFRTDDIYRLGGNQRAKLQYHILAQRFPLVLVSEQDRDDLEAFCASHKAETAKRWLNRMAWENGLEKMITFGVALEVRIPAGMTRRPWCYSARMDTKTAVFSGEPMTWEEWAAPIKSLLDFRREELNRGTDMTQQEREQLVEDTYNEALMKLSYQHGLYMTLPGEEYRRLKEWVYKYLYDGAASFPYAGAIPDGDYTFTIDFERDIEIVATPDLHTDMGQYNREFNAERNKERGRKLAEERFAQLVGDEWTTQEILAQGFTRKALDSFVKYGLIERLKRGFYRRKSV